MKKLVLTIFYCSLTAWLIAQVPIYKGGKESGFSTNCYHQSSTSGVPFYGGKEDGFSVKCLLEDPALGNVLFKGGDGDGFDVYCYEEDVTEVFGVFTGGDNHGFDMSCYEEALLTSSLLPFYGGNEDGFDVYCYEQVSSINDPVFYGGKNDGFDVSCYQESTLIGNILFTGGDGDGFDVSCYEEDLTVVYGTFTGGNDYGNNLVCHQQTDYLFELPIQLISFLAKLIDKIVYLTWETASEQNNDYFVVERSADLDDWYEIDIVNGAGNSNVILAYKSKDFDPLLGTGYYRLKQIDFDGRYTNSFVRTIVNNPKIEPKVLTYPNPALDRLNIMIMGFDTNLVDIKFYSILGQQIYEKQIELINGAGHIEIERTLDMKPGYTLMTISTKTGKRIQKKIVFK